MKTSNPVRFKRREMQSGDRIVVLDNINNGLISLKPFDEGSIIYLQNQVKATIWFRQFGRYSNDVISKALEVDTSFTKNPKLDGLTLELKRESFALKYQYQGFDDITVDEDKASSIPFFKNNDELKLPSNFQRNVGNGVFETIHQYLLRDLIDMLSDGFDEWVKNNTKSRKIRKSEKENGDYPEHWDTVLTEESQNHFYHKKAELELSFAKATGVFYEFNGGLLFE